MNNKIRFTTNIDIETGKYDVKIEKSDGIKYDHVRNLLQQVLDELDIKLANPAPFEDIRCKGVFH